MRRPSKLYLMLIAMFISSALVVGVLSSCSDDPVPITTDGPVVKKDGSVPLDQYVYPDIPPKPDRIIYPDVRPPSDVRPWVHAEGYTGGTFGCLSDSDCFGQLCCETPWGVNLCAPACEY